MIQSNWLSEKTSNNVGPHQSPFIFARINSVNSITWNYKIEFMLILKYLKKSWKLDAEENDS